LRFKVLGVSKLLMDLQRLWSALPLNVLAVVGLVIALCMLKNVLGFVWVYFLRPAKNIKKFGQWAVITGATDGIGKAYAHELARRGMSVFLLSRNQQKLDEVAQELSSKFKVETKTMAIDFTKFQRGSPNLEKVSAAIQSMEVGVLINNVGVSYDYPQYFTEFASESVGDLMACNLDAVVWLTRAVLPAMEARKSGAIVNVSSLLALSSSPLLSVYSATKAFIENFSISLNAEYKSRGVSIQSHVSALVATKLAKIRNASLFTPSPGTFARAAVRQIGYAPSVAPYWPHALQLAVVSCLPKRLAAKYMLDLHKAIRARALKKLASSDSQKKE